MFRCNPYGGFRSHGPVCAAIGKRALTDWSETATADSASIRHGAVCVRVWNYFIYPSILCLSLRHNLRGPQTRRLVAVFNLNSFQHCALCSVDPPHVERSRALF